MKRKLTKKRIIIVAVAAVVAVLGGVGVYYYLHASAALKSIAKSGTVADLLVAAPLNGESTGRVNLLIAGNSVDDPGHGGSALTDSIMIASYSVSTRALTLISVPRDLYVKANGAYMKINAAYQVGGMAALQQTVQVVTGLTINHSVLINYQAFKQMIDALGGIDMTIEADDPRGIYDPMIGFSIGNGVQYLDGQSALLLARCRNDPTNDGRIAYGLSRGDFDRAANQRKITEALLAKAGKVETFMNPNTMQAFVTSLQGNVTSDFTAGQLRRLYDISQAVATTKSVGLQGDASLNLLADYYSADGASLVPADGIGVYGSLQQYVQDALQATP